MTDEQAKKIVDAILWLFIPYIIKFPDMQNQWKVAIRAIIEDALREEET